MRQFIATLISTAFVFESYAAERTPHIEEIIVGNHSLEILDQTGKFSAAYDASASEFHNDPCFKWTYDDQLPYSASSNGSQFEFFTQKHLRYVNSTKITVERDENGTIEIAETDTQPTTEYQYLTKVETAFIDFYNHNRHKGFLDAPVYLYLGHKPDSKTFEPAYIKDFIKGCYSPEMIESVKEYRDVSLFCKKHGKLKAKKDKKKMSLFYNRHGIVAVLHEESARKAIQTITLVYQNPSDKKNITLKTQVASRSHFVRHEPEFYYLPLQKFPPQNYRLETYVENTPSPNFFVITDSKHSYFNDERAFLNGETATMLKSQEIIDLWESQ